MWFSIVEKCVTDFRWYTSNTLKLYTTRKNMLRNVSCDTPRDIFLI